MPIYEFYCPHNHRIYQFLARSSAQAGRVPRCPDNPDWPLVREFSPFAITGRHREEPKAPDAPDPLDDPRMEAAMAELERDFGDLDDENPDPRRLGHLMRRMSAITGEAMPAAMAEMVSRLEAGEDPERLEEEYGDALDEPLPGEADAADGEAGATPGRARWRSLLRQRAPRRDPQLYDMAEYL